MLPTPSIIAQATRPAADTAADTLPVFLQPGWAIALVIGALGVSLAISYLARLPGLRSVRHWLLLGRALAWTFVIASVAFTLARAVSPDNWLLVGLVMLALVSAASINWLRNVIAGLALEFERNFRPGNLVRYEQLEGELVEFGTRSVTLRADDGTLHQIPNRSFTETSVTHLEADGEAACEVVVSLPKGISPERALDLAKEAAFLTPLASPHHRPEAFLEVASSGEGRIALHVRGFAFDPAYRAHFRSDVVARVHEILRTEQALRASS